MRSRRAGGVLVAALVLMAHLSHAAFAGFSDRTTSAAMSVSTSSIAAPTNLSATSGCVLLTPHVTVSWTASASSFTTGYRVLRSSAGGPFTQVGSVQGRSATAFTDTVVVGGTTYVYVVQAVYQNWSAASGEASAAVPLVCV